MEQRSVVKYGCIDQYFLRSQSDEVQQWVENHSLQFVIHTVTEEERLVRRDTGEVSMPCREEGTWSKKLEFDGLGQMTAVSGR